MAALNSVGKLLVIVGETASGKSKLALELAKQFNGEIISADSWTVYRGFNIGTAKPSVEEQAQVAHHLLDIADPRVGYSAAEFKRRASEVIIDINNRGNLPILVGGTGLYIDSVIYDYGFLPAGTSEQREHLNTLTIEELMAKIKAAKINTKGIDTRNKRRLIRLIETRGLRPNKGGLRPKTLILGLALPVETLVQRITERVDNMLKSGLKDEVKSLADKYGWDTEPMKGIGYREWRNHFEGKQSLEQTKESIIRSSLQLAKKQRTWFRSSRYDQPSDHNATIERNKSIQWLQNLQQALPVVQKFLSK